MQTNTHLTTIETLSLFETSKAEREYFAIEILNKIEAGEISPLKVHLQIKAMESIITTLTSTDERKNKLADVAKKYKQYLIDAAAQYGGKTFELYNAKFTNTETGTKYDFSQCGDTALMDMCERMEVLKKEIKDREDFLKTVPVKGLTTANEETGEVATLFPPSKTSTTSLSVTLK